MSELGLMVLAWEPLAVVEAVEQEPHCLPVSLDPHSVSVLSSLFLYHQLASVLEVLVLPKYKW